METSDRELRAMLYQTVELQFSDPAGTLRLLDEIVERATDTRDPETSTAATAALARTMRAHLRRDHEAAVTEAQRALELLPPDDMRGRGTALQAFGRAAEAAGDIAKARAIYELGLTEARASGRARAIGTFLLLVGSTQLASGELEAAAASSLEARAVHARRGDRLGEELALHQHGAVLAQAGATVEAISVLREATALCRELGHDALLAGRLASLSEAERESGQTEQALRTAKEAIRLLSAVPHPGARCFVLAAGAHAWQEAGHPSRAVDVCREQLAEAERLGYPSAIAHARALLASMLLETGAVEDARHHADVASALAHQTSEYWLSVICETALGSVCRAEGEPTAAAVHFRNALERTPVQDPRRRARGLRLLASALTESGEYEEAIAKLQESTDLLDKAFQAESGIRLQHIRSLRQVERAEASAAAARRGVARALIEAQEAERRRVAREIHDDLSQSLASHMMELNDVLEVTPGLSDETRQRLVALSGELRQTASTMHRISRRLHPAILERLGLESAAQAFVAEIGKHHPIEIHFDAEGLEDRLPPALELCLYRVIQESIQNVQRHSHAEAASVAIQRAGGAVRLVIEDHGNGFDVEAAQQGGIGLVGMRERVQHVGGSLYLRSAPGAGTRVEVRIPLEDA